jgi:hypothetical protein
MTDRRSLTLGLVLLFVGLYFLLWRSFRFSGPGAILILIGAVFFTLSAIRRWRGPLLPAGILLGLGAGFLLQDSLTSTLPRWATLLLGLGAGFLLVAAIDRAADRDRRPPPLVPGLVLVGVALLAAIAQQVDLTEPLARLAELWPWALVLAGVALVVTALRRRSA